MIRKAFIAVGVSLLATWNIQPLKADETEALNVVINREHQVTYEERTRLRQVLEHALTLNPDTEVYWPTVKLVDLRDDHAPTQQKQIIRDLDALATHWHEEGNIAQYEAAIAIRRQVESWRVGTQPFQDINLALSRQTLDHNPLLPIGDYELLINEREPELYVYGALNNPGRLVFEAGMPVSDYVRALNKQDQVLPGYNRNQAVLIRRGEYEFVDWAYYSASPKEAQPGDIIWLGFNRLTLPAEFRHLHTAIPELLTHHLGALNAHESLYSVTDEGAEVPASNHWSRLDYAPRRNNYGGVGLMQTPTARMADVGEAILSYSDMQEYYRYTVSLQLFPWLEASGFYTRIPNRLYSRVPEFSGNTILTDKGFDVKARLLRESYYVPEVSVGLRDLAGTGLFDGEYIVANKRVGPFDFSLGAGFGRLGSRGDVSNPFCQIYDAFCDRPSGFTQGGGSFEYDQWFRGPAALFGGVEYQTPWQPLRIALEYEGNDYSQDNAGVPIEPSTAWNIGANYQFTDWLDAQISYERGDTLMFNVTLRTNFNTLKQVRVEPERVGPTTEPRAQSLDDVHWANLDHQLFYQYAFEGSRFAVDGDTLSVFTYPSRYRDYDTAVDRASRVLAAEVPDEIKTYDFVNMTVFDPAFSTHVDADAFKARINNEDLGKSVNDTEELFVRTAPTQEHDDDDPRWLFNPKVNYATGFGLRPFLHQDFGAPEDFHFYQLGVGAFARKWIMPRLELFGEVGINIADNYHKFNFDRDRLDDLPPVRTDVRSYVQNDVWLDSLQATYFHRFSDDVTAMAYAGYFERMFGGVGAEMLYRPLDKNWMLGADINRVRQREYDGFGFFDYEVTTGFVSWYYQMPWLADSMLRMDFGRFLAGDHGVNVTFQRRFDSGITAGAFAAITDVSSDEYGEGNFTKGFFVHIPFDLIGVRPTRQRIGVHWIPLARNGGRQLIRRIELHQITDDTSPFYHR